MKLFGHFLSVWLSKEHCSRIRICVSIWLLRQMTSHLFLLILSSLAVSLQLGLEDVFFNPQDQMVREGEEVFFQCVSGESSPPASITWLKDGALVTTARQFQGAYGGGDEKKTSGTLHLFNATTVDDGMYICVTHNALLNTSKRSKPAKLTVQGVPKRLQITDGPDNITAAIGTDVSMRCTVYGFPVPMVHWFKDSCPLNNCSTCSTSFILHNNGQLLTFRNLTREDEGFYHCEASNQKETIKSLSAYLLPAEMDWVFIQNPTNRTVKKGENVTFTCRPPYSRPEAQVSWFKNNKPIIPTASTTLLPNGDLFIHSVQEQDSGSYFCRASNIHLRRFLSSRRAVITVLAPPSAQLWPQALTVPLGGRVLLQCQVSGNPQPTITWVKRGHSKQTGGKFILGLRNTTLYIQSARKYDEGLYVCVASNTLGQSHNASLLRVAVSPIIVTFVGEVRCRIGASAVLPCRAVGILPITYSWSRGGAETQSPVTPTEGTHIDENGTLHISNVQYYHDGEYYCTAENRAGRHQRFTILKVTAGHQDGDRSNQTRHLSVGRITSKAPTISQFTDVPRQHRKRTPVLQVHQQHDKTTCSLFHCGTTTMRATTYSTYYQGAVAELEIPQRSLGQLLQHNLYQPMTVSPQPFMTQMQPPTFQPLSTQLYTQIPPLNVKLL
ncbi:contactin-5-like [Antennarius striatus]|uniref:contactin-5-like n=1 Tax=Antennarius striatus TaxID=241820 RepID=UPI0035B2F54A